MDYFIVNNEGKCALLKENEIEFRLRHEIYGLAGSLNNLKHNIRQWLDPFMSKVMVSVIKGRNPKKKYLELIKTLTELSIDSDEEFEKVPVKFLVRDSLYHFLSAGCGFSIPLLTDYIRKDTRFVYFNIKSQTREVEKDFVANNVGGVLDIFRKSVVGPSKEFSCRCRDEEKMLLWVMSSSFIESFKEENTKEEIECIKKIEELIGVYL